MSLDAILDGVAANALTLIIVFHVIESLWEIYITYRQVNTNIIHNTFHVLIGK